MIFVGITADDIAVGGFLEALKRDGISLGDHFWITSRTDLETHRWAQGAGIQIIRYDPIETPEGADHQTVLLQMFQNIRNFKSKDVSPPPVVSSLTGEEAILPPNDLLRADDDQIRFALAKKAKSILQKNNNDTNSLEYAAFLEEYKRPIFFVMESGGESTTQ